MLAWHQGVRSLPEPFDAWAAVNHLDPDLAGLAALIELVYRLQLNDSTGSTLRYLGFTLDTQSAASWLGALAVAAIGFAAFEFVRRRFALKWGRIQGEIEAAMTFKEPNAPIPEGGQAAAREASLGTP